MTAARPRSRPRTREPAGAAFEPHAESEETTAARPYGLALSGGGYRATLFHLGALCRLNELGLLPRLGRISTVSGGSLLAGFLALAWNDLDFGRNGVAGAFHTRVFDPVWRFTRRRIDAFVVAAGLVPFVSPGGLLEQVLDRSITRGATLADLPDPDAGAPLFVFNAAHLATGTNWRFTRRYMENYRLGRIDHPVLPLARAIAASAAFPPLVSPVTLRVQPTDFRYVKGADLFHRDDLKRRVLLLDGGAYDNMGVQTLLRTCRLLLSSDAGGDLSVSPARWRYSLWTVQIKRTLDMAVDQGRALRRRELVAAAQQSRQTGAWQDASATADRAPEHVALWRTALDVRRLPDTSLVVPVAEGWDRYLSTRKTRMWPHPIDDAERLVNWGYVTSDVIVRTYIPEFRSDPPGPGLPFPKRSFATAPST